LAASLRCHALQSSLAIAWKKWEADTIDRASLNIENTARSSASAGAFTFGGVGWIGHSRLPA
jgi:hypothetical protein